MAEHEKLSNTIPFTVQERRDLILRQVQDTADHDEHAEEDRAFCEELFAIADSINTLGTEGVSRLEEIGNSLGTLLNINEQLMNLNSNMLALVDAIKGSRR